MYRIYYQKIDYWWDQNNYIKSASREVEYLEHDSIDGLKDDLTSLMEVLAKEQSLDIIRQAYVSISYIESLEKMIKKGSVYNTERTEIEVITPILFHNEDDDGMDVKRCHFDDLLVEEMKLRLDECKVHHAKLSTKKEDDAIAQEKATLQRLMVKYPNGVKNV